VIVDAYLEANLPGIFVAGDIAGWPDPHSGENIRVEHGSLPNAKVKLQRSTCWAIERNLSRCRSFGAKIMYSNQLCRHAEKWDEVTINGDLTTRDCLLSYKRNGRVLAVASIYRDLESLEAELAMEKNVI
jgi:apoptosis-inducing factor 3